MQAQADAGQSPRLGMNPNGRLSPGKGWTMKEYDQQISLLKKENFSLKMRIFYMEEGMQQQYGGSQDVFKTNIELRVQMETLKKDLAEKQIVIQRASQAMDTLTLNQQEAEASIRQRCEGEYQELLNKLKADVEKKEKECEECRQEAQTFKDKVGQLDADLKCANLKNKDMTQKFENAKFDIQSLTGQLKLSKQSVKDLDLEKDGAMARAKKLSRQFEELKQQIAHRDQDSQDKCLDQTMEIEDHMKKISDLEGRLKDRDCQNHALEDEAQEKAKKLKNAGEELDKTQRDLEEKGLLLDRYKKSAESVVRKLVEKEKLSTSLNEKLIKWKEQYSEQEKKLKALEQEKKQVQRQSMMDMAIVRRDNTRLSIQLQEAVSEQENAIHSLGRKEGELSRFRDQLKRAMEALIHSEHAVEDLQAQLRAERAEYDNKLRQQALQFQLSLSFNQENDEAASLKQKVKELQNLIADQNVNNLALGREKAELEKCLAQSTSRNETIEALKEEHSTAVQKLEREIKSLKLELNGKEVMIESIQHHPLVIETNRRVSTITSYQIDVRKQPSVLDIETIWVDLLEDMKKTLKLLRTEIQSRLSPDGQPLNGDSATADLLLSEIKSIQRVYQHLEEGVEKNSKLHEVLLHSLRNTRQSTASTDSPDSSCCQDGGPSTIPTRDSHFDQVDSLDVIRHSNSWPHSASLFPSKNQQLIDRSSQTHLHHHPSVFEEDTEEIVNRYLQTRTTSPADKSLDFHTSSQAPKNFDQSMQIGIPIGELFNRSMQTSALVNNSANVDSLRGSPSIHISSQGNASANNNSQGLINSGLSTGGSPPFKGQFHQYSSGDHLQSSALQNSQLNDKPKFTPCTQSPSSNLGEDSIPSELVREARGRRVTFDLSCHDLAIGLTDDAKEGHLKKTHGQDGSCLASFTKDDDSLLDETYIGDLSADATGDITQGGQLHTGVASPSKEDNNLSISNDTSLIECPLPVEGETDQNEEDERGTRDGGKNSLTDDIESYSVAKDQDSSGVCQANTSSLSPGQQQQLKHQHQQVIVNMSAQELRDLIAQLQQDLIDSVKQNHSQKDQMTNVQEKLHATENTVRYQSLRIKSYKAALEKAGLAESVSSPSSSPGNGTLLAPLSDRSCASVERARASQPVNMSLPLSMFGRDRMLEGSLTDIQSVDGSPTQSMSSVLSTRSRTLSASLPSGLCFQGNSPSSKMAPRDSAATLESPVRGYGYKDDNFDKGDYHPTKDNSPGPQDKSKAGNSLPSSLPMPVFYEANSFLDPTYTSLIDTTLFPHLDESKYLDKTCVSSGNTTMNVDKLQSRVTQLEQMNAALRQEIKLVNDLCASQGIELEAEKAKAGTSPLRNTTSRVELLRKHLIEIRQLRQRLERLDLGNDPDQHLIFQTHIHQRIHHQESLIIKLQKQLEDNEDKWNREMAETQHRLGREKTAEVERAEKETRSRVEAEQTGLRNDLEEQILKLKNKCSALEKAEFEASRMSEEKRRAEQDLVKRELEILDMEKSLFTLEMAKEGLEVKVRQISLGVEEKEREVQALHKQMRDHKESARVTREALIKREETLRESESAVQRMTQEKVKLTQRLKKQDVDLAAAAQREEEVSSEVKVARDKRRELELRLVDAEEDCKRRKESVHQANRQIGLLQDKLSAAEKSLGLCQEELRASREELRKCQESLASCQELLKASQETMLTKDQKVLKRDKQLKHLINQYKKLDVAYTKLQYKLEEKKNNIDSLKRVNTMYEALYKQNDSEDLTQNLLQELVSTKRQVADLLTRLEGKSKDRQPTVTVKAFGSTVVSSQTDTILKTTTIKKTDSLPKETGASANDDKLPELGAGSEPGDIDEAFDQLSASMHQEFGQDDMVDEILPQVDNSASCDPILKEQNENLREQLMRLQCRYDVLDHKVKEQGSRLQASTVRQKDWEKSLCRQLTKTTRDMEQAKENIGLSTKVLHVSPKPRASFNGDPSSDLQ